MSRLERPIIIIGAGRSGSSLLNAALDAHPDIAMLGEMAFTVPALWDCFWNVSAAVHARSRYLEEACRHRGIIPDALPESQVLALVGDLERAERERLSDVVRRTIDQVYRLSESPTRNWGFKEIWLESGSRYQWKPYDHIFPGAFYVHVVRHPFAYARSAADWNRIALTPKVLRHHLESWVDLLTTNRARAATGRYVLLTYEALTSNPRAALSPLLTRLGLPWDDACLSAFGRRHVASPRRSPMPRGASRLVAKVPGLAKLMAEFGYQPPQAADDSLARPADAVDVASRLGDRTWRLNPPFEPEGACGWLVPLSASALLASLTAFADDLENPWRSEVRLCENGAPLGPAHSLHLNIRQAGGGRYSHWAVGNFLLFSTSDNSNPNANARRYTITLHPPGPAGRSQNPWPNALS